MRKARLVILPTKCLHQMGFLLLFLSCPVIGDWGRIRPESENSHNAILIEREGTCGLERDPPGGLLDFLNDTGSKQCRLSEDPDLNKSGGKPAIEEPIFIRSVGKRIHARRVNQRESERRMIERRDSRREFQRNVRSRSVESRRSTRRNDLRVRSLSLSRLENEQTIRDRSTRRYSHGSRRRETERLHTNRQNERRVEERRLNRDIPNERREYEIRGRNNAERREREVVRRFTRSGERETQDIWRDNKRRSFQVSSRRQNGKRSETAQERSERRLSLARKEVQDANKERIGNKRMNLETRLPEIRKARSLEFLTREKYVRTNRNLDNSRDAEERRIVSVPVKSERNLRERRVGLFSDRMDKFRRTATTRELNLEKKVSEDKKPFEWTNFKKHDGFKTGDWTTNCVIGAVVYYFTTRQIKTV